MCRHVWAAWVLGCVATFTYAELRGYYTGCHPTLSRQLQAWTGCKRHPSAALVFVGLGGLLAWHLATLREES
jgi:hypothetical protein